MPGPLNMVKNHDYGSLSPKGRHVDVIFLNGHVVKLHYKYYGYIHRFMLYQTLIKELFL